MAIREILIYPQHKSELHRKSFPVIKIDRKIFLLIQDLKDTLSESKKGVGLVSPQINIHQRVIVVCLGNESDGERQTDPPIALITPQIIESSDERKDFDGCLSFPGLFGKTIRPHYLQVKGLDPKGKPLFTRKKSAVLAFFAAALSTPMGTLVSFPIISKINRNILGLLLAISAGALIYVGATHLLPTVEKENKKFSLVSLSTGILIAILIVISKG